MGTAQLQGELWGARADDWARLQEPAWNSVFSAILDELGVSDGTRLLDVGCGAGGALVLARARGALVTGLDASESLTAIARERLPGARIECGDMETLPFPDGAFDAVTSFNAFQFAGDLQQALREARRVCRHGGRVMMLVWGPNEDCDLSRLTFPAIFALLPKPPAASAPARPLSAPGAIEERMGAAGLQPVSSGDVDCVFTYGDAATTWRAIASAGGVVRAIRHAGEDVVRRAVLATLGPLTDAEGMVHVRNRFHWVIATPAAV
jgi:SAM-dependent methyltransferase